MAIQRLDDRKADGVDLLVSSRRIVAELPEYAFEAIVRPAPIVAHLDAEVAKLFENRARARIKVASVLRHESTVASHAGAVNVEFQIPTA
jgi:hypothetical protein